MSIYNLNSLETERNAEQIKKRKVIKKNMLHTKIYSDTMRFELTTLGSVVEWIIYGDVPVKVRCLSNLIYIHSIH